MFTNHLKIAWRSLERNKMYSFVNISGLAIGLAVCMLIVLYVGHELSYDKFHKNAERIVWVQAKIKMGGDSVFMPGLSYVAAPLAKQKVPSVEDFTRFMEDYPIPVIENPQLPLLRFAETGFLFADSNFFDFFSFELIEGYKQEVLKKPFTMVISQKIAQKYFGKQDPIGKIIRYNNAYYFTITGVAEKTPSNSSINYDFVASLSSISAINEKKSLTGSQNVEVGSFSSYFLLKHPQDAERLEAGLLQLDKNASKSSRRDERYIAVPLTQTHLNASYNAGTNIKYLKIFPFVAALVLLLAIINYMSLSTARSTIRSKEIGVRKVLGADRKTIALQFFVESALFTAISFVLGYILCVAFQPLFFNFLQIDIDKSFLHSPIMIGSFSVLFFITLLLAASYPSILLSAYKPVLVLYGKFNKKNGGPGIRKFFTVFQFSIAILLIVCGIVIDRQMYFLRHADTGVDRENIVMIPFAQTIGKHYTAFQREVQALAPIRQTTTDHYPMYKGTDMFFVKANKSNINVPLPVLTVDENFISLLNLKWKIPPADSLFYLKNNTIILNEAAVEKLDFGIQPLNRKLAIGDQDYYIAGVLKDFNYESLEGKIGALGVFMSRDTISSWGQVGGCLFAKIKPRTNTPEVIQQLKTIYEKYDAATPFEYYFMDDVFNAMYKAEDRLSKIFSVFTAFTLLIACLGLFGLSTFMALQRTKEVGIRKVLGASVRQVAALLSKDFIKLVLVAIVIASPLAWWAMNKWLEAFAYRVQISWWMFVLADVMALVIALATVGFQAINAAIANPVKSLRTE
jgi:putative ABC transport system permease protein